MQQQVSERHMHGTSRLWKPRAETEEMRTRRETQRESQRASQRSLEGMKHAGMMTERQDNKVESVKRFPGAGDASLRTFGSSKWGVQATKDGTVRSPSSSFMPET